jgi:hypothetical protein
MPITDAFRAELYSDATPEALILLARVTNPETGEIYYLCNDNVPITSRGQDYTPFPFSSPLPSQLEGEIPRVTMRFDNVGRELTALFQSTIKRAPIELELVSTSDVDTVQSGPYYFMLSSAKGDTTAIECTLEYESFQQEPAPAHRFTPKIAPGYFA